jgi:hypothetical protein
LRRRSGNRPFRLDSDEAPDPDRCATLDHGVEVRVGQHGLQERDSHVGLALNRSIADNSRNDATSAHLDDLDLVLRPVRNGDTALPWANPEDARQVMALWPLDPKRPLRDL